MSTKITRIDSPLEVWKLFHVGLSVDEDVASGVKNLDATTLPNHSCPLDNGETKIPSVETNGRTFNPNKDGMKKYFLPNDLVAQGRLNLQHEVAKELYGGLTLASINKPERVLDIGTGTGIWAIEFATQNPESQVIGIDLSPIQPDGKPPNVHFQLHDAESTPWPFTHPFSYIHARFLVVGISDYHSILRTTLTNLTPGTGYAEFQEVLYPFQCIDDTISGTSLERWNKLFVKALALAGKDGFGSMRLRQVMEDVGFVDVREEWFAAGGNSWVKKEGGKKLAEMELENLSGAMHGFGVGGFTTFLGMSVKEVEDLVGEVRRDMEDREIHWFCAR